MAADLTVRQWAATLGVTRQRAYEIVKRCGIPMQGGKVDSAEANRAWRNKRDAVQADRAGRAITPPTSPQWKTKAAAAVEEPTPRVPARVAARVAAAVSDEDEHEAEDTSIAEAQRLREWVRLKREKLDLDVRSGELVETAGVNRFVGGIILRSAEVLDRIPDELADRLAQSSDPVVCREMLRREIARARSFLAEYRSSA